MAKAAIVVRGLQKSYGQLKVLDGIDFAVKPGTILALLGPNGAGKTTTIRILSTLLQPDGGQALINGHDVVKDAAKVRASIGMTGQYAAVDEYLTGAENLHMMARLYRLSIADAKRRTGELLKLVDLEQDSTRPVKQYSGGMKRRIDLAIASPPVIFLDEPTTGLDPRSRLSMWGAIKQLVKNGTAILLTTQYMDEADHLADNIVVIDEGKVIAEGTANQLKAKVGSDRLQITINKNSDFDSAVSSIDGEGLQADREHRIISIASKGGVRKLKEALQNLEEAKIDVETISLHRPTLDDVFMTLTGHTASKETAGNEQDKPKGKK